MKSFKKLFLLTVVTLMALSCSNSIESDAKKAAELSCKAQKLAMKAASGDADALEESTKLAAEATALFEKMQGKYESIEDAQKFVSAYQKALADCK